MTPAGLSPRRRILLGVTALLGVAALLTVLGPFVASDLLGQRRDVPAADRPGPVLLVPGYGGGTAGLSVLADRLRATGRKATVVELPGTGTDDLAGQARVLDGYVTRELRAGAPSVDMVGYSAGGVVVRFWVQAYDGPRKARRVVTLGSPHHGAELAGTGSLLVPDACPAACQQLAPGSRFLAGLRSPVPVPPLWLSLWTVDDRTVTPPESARLDGAVNVPIQSVCPGRQVSHSELPTDPVVTAMVVAALGTGALAADVPGCEVRPGGA